MNPARGQPDRSTGRRTSGYNGEICLSVNFFGCLNRRLQARRGKEPHRRQINDQGRRFPEKGIINGTAKDWRGSHVDFALNNEYDRIAAVLNRGSHQILR